MLCVCVCVWSYLKQRCGGYGLNFPLEGCLPLCWGHGRWVEGSVRVVWIPAPGATSLGLYSKKKKKAKQKSHKKNQMKAIQ